MNFTLTKVKDLNHSKTRLKIYLTKIFKKSAIVLRKLKSPEKRNTRSNIWKNITLKRLIIILGALYRTLI